MAGTEPRGARGHLVVVLPGIGGSRLVVPGGSDEVIWDATYGDAWNLLRRPEHLSLDRYPELQPLGLIRSRALFGIWAKIEGYESLLNRLRDLKDVVLDDGTHFAPNLRANVVAVGYDFRLGVEKAAEYLDGQLQPRLRELWPRPEDRAGKIIFVAHSMGGLVARLWLAQDGNAAMCRELITLGTPHRGAPKALDLLANGVAVNGIHVIRGGVLELLRTWQGVYDLLPTENEVEDLTHDVPEWRGAFSLPLAWSQDRAKASKHLHESIGQGWKAMTAEVRPSVQPRIGSGHGTQRSCTWDGERVSVSNGPSGRRGLGRWLTELGDGTVPVLSGLPPELREVPTGLWAGLKHGQIANLPEAVERVQDAEEFPIPQITEGERRQLVLGVDVAELTIEGEPTPVAATVRGLGGFDGEGICVAMVEADDGAGHLHRVRLQWDSGSSQFIGELPALRPGGHTVRFDWEDGDALTTASSLEVIRDDLAGLESA